jgi:hypothetical protein
MSRSFDAVAGSRPFVDLKHRRPSPRGQSCFIDGPTAFLVPKLRDVERDGRRTLPTMTQTDVNMCNHLLSPDHRTLGVVTAKVASDRRHYLDAEMSFFGEATGAFRTRLPLAGTSPIGVGASLESTFSPSSKWLAVKFGTGWQLLDLVTGHSVASKDIDLGLDQVETIEFGPSETLVHSPLVDDIRFVGLQDGSIRRFPMEERGCVSEGMLVPLAQCAEGVDGGVEDASK